MANYANAINTGGAIKNWDDARVDAELSALASGDTWTLTLETDSDGNQVSTCTFGAGFWAGVNIVVKSDVKYTKRWSFMRTAGSPSGDEHINWNQGGAGTLDMSDVIFDSEGDDSPFGHVRNGTIPSGQQLYERCAWVDNLSGAMDGDAFTNIVFVNCIFFDLADRPLSPGDAGPKLIYCMGSSLAGEAILKVADSLYDNETKNVIASEFDPDHNDISSDSNYCASEDGSADPQFTNNAINKATDTTRFQTIVPSVTNINAKTFLQIKNHTSVAGMYGLAGIAPTFAEPTDDFYGNVRDTADRDLGPTAIAAAAGVFQNTDEAMTGGLEPMSGGLQ